jgi:hypothetical protein
MRNEDVLATIEDIEKGGEKKSREKKKELPVQEMYSKRLLDGTIIEALYDRKKEETEFVLWKDGKEERKREVEYNGTLYVPPKPSNTLLVNGFVKLAEEIFPYSTETKLFEQIKQFIHAYLDISESFENIASYYVMLSYVYDEFEVLPYLRAIGDFGSGKSRFLKIIGSLCYKAIFLNGSSSSAAIFRMIESVKGSLIFDEADFHHSDTTSEIIKILNSGFQKGMPVLRAEGNNKTKSYDPKAFNVFCPKIIATRKDFSDLALESRCLTEIMHPLSRKDIPLNLPKEMEEWASLLRGQLLMYRFEKLEKGISLKEFPDLEDVEPRLLQISLPLYSIVNDKENEKRILDFITQKQRQIEEERHNSFEGEVFLAYMSLYENGEREPSYKLIAERCTGGKYPVKPQKIGNLMKTVFLLQTQRKKDGTVVKDCEKNDLQREVLIKKYAYREPKMNTVNPVNPSEGKEEQEKYITSFEEMVAVLDADDYPEKEQLPF